MIRGVIFDIDGTLLDSMPVWEHAGEWYLKSQGKQAEAGLAKRLFTMSLPESAVYLKKEYGLLQMPEEIVAGINSVIFRFYREEVQLKPGAAAFLKALQNKNVRITAATSSDRDLIEAAFKRLGISECFERIFTCTEVGKGKTEPDIYLAAAEWTGAAPDEIWVFEDALHALITAGRAGFRTVGVFDAASRNQTEEIRVLSDLYLEDLKSFESFWERALVQ